MTMTELDWLVDDYLRQLEGALSALPASRRAQIVAEISEHVTQARTGLATQDEPSIRELLKRVGAPTDIAAAAFAEGVPTAPRRSPGRRRELLTIAAVALLLVIGVVAYLAQGGSGAVTMPEVLGKSPDAAQSVLESSGIKHIDIEVLPSLAPANTVFTTNFKVGSVVRPGSYVNLEVSSGPSVVPALPGTSASKAEAELAKLGLHWAVVREHSAQFPQFPQGAVVGQAPAPGSKLEKQSWVEIDVASSSSAVPSSMPAVGFMEPAQFAIAELHSLGLKVQVNYVTRPGYQPGWVVAFTGPGTRLTSSGAYLSVDESASRDVRKHP